RATQPLSEARIMPSAARALHETGVAAKDVAPTGPGGRMLKEDVQRATEARASAPAAATAPAAPLGAREEEIVPMTPMRRRIAERLVEAKIFFFQHKTSYEIDMTGV